MSTVSVSSAAARAARRPVRPFAWLRTALDVRAQRARLADLDASRLADIGLTPTEAGAEAARPLWDVPRHWLR